VQRLRLLGVTYLLSATFASHAVADEKRGQVRIDFDELKGEIVKHDGQWLLEVRYEVEHKRPNEMIPLGLRITLSERGRPLVDAKGRPVLIHVTLNRPTERDDEEIEYEGSILTKIPTGSFLDPNKLRLYGEVIRPGGRSVLARRDKSVSYDKPHRRWRPSIGVSVCVGPVSVGVDL
jgi:hypothetical protein